MAYTYQDFEKAAAGSGLNFSQYDMDLAKKYPEFGMSILNLKKDYAGATTEEQRTLANTRANELRKSYGNYSGGADGSEYLSQGKYAGMISDTLDKMGSFGSFSYDAAPTYENRFQQRQQELLDRIIDRPDFSWSKETDPQYGSYKKTYLREGERATADALAKASAASAGRPSSYAVNAATQAGDYYATKLSDVIPTLYQQAYERYLKDYQMKLSDLEAVNGQEQLDYAKYLDRLGQFNTDRNFAYNSYLGDFDRMQSLLDAYRERDDTGYNRYLDVLDQAKAKQELQRSQIDAILQAGGSPSAELVGKSGYESEYVRALENYYKQQAAQQSAKSGGSGGGSSRSGGSGGQDYNGLMRDADASGHPQSFIANNYKKYGFTSATGLYNEYQDWVKSGNNQYNTALFSAAMRSLSTLLAQGKIAEAENGINSFWDKLSSAQREKVSALIQRYGGSMGED